MDAVAAGDIHTKVVLGLAAQVRARRREGVQLVVSRAPEDVLELALGHGEGQLQVRLGLAHVAAQDQPVVRVRRDLLDRFSVELVAEVEVSEGV